MDLCSDTSKKLYLIISKSLLTTNDFLKIRCILYLILSPSDNVSANPDLFFGKGNQRANQ